MDVLEGQERLVHWVKLDQLVLLDSLDLLGRRDQLVLLDQLEHQDQMDVLEGQERLVHWVKLDQLVLLDSLDLQAPVVLWVTLVLQDL
jgi:hypothetical protein